MPSRVGTGRRSPISFSSLLLHNSKDQTFHVPFSKRWTDTHTEKPKIGFIFVGSSIDLPKNYVTLTKNQTSLFQASKSVECETSFLNSIEIRIISKINKYVFVS